MLNASNTVPGRIPGFLKLKKMKTSRLLFTALVIAFLLTLPLAKSMAQKTSVPNVYYDVNGQITLSWLSDKPAAMGQLKGIVLDTAANVYMNYPIYGQVAVTTENGLYRITVWNIYFQSENLALPVEMWAKKGRNKIRNKEAVQMLERELKATMLQK